MVNLLATSINDVDIFNNLNLNQSVQGSQICCGGHLETHGLPGNANPFSGDGGLIHAFIQYPGFPDHVFVQGPCTMNTEMGCGLGRVVGGRQ